MNNSPEKIKPKSLFTMKVISPSLFRKERCMHGKLTRGNKTQIPIDKKNILSNPPKYQ